MDVLNTPEFLAFLLRAKKATYAAGDRGKVESSRPASHDLAYREGAWAYLDTYLGGIDFLGEEAVWQAGVPVWGMNYCGRMMVDTIPDGFSDFLKLALREVPADAPYRGPAQLAEGRFEYGCRWEGAPEWFSGEECITYDGQLIYRLNFHGGAIHG
ncbi:MAG TPA: DUF5680 domain-containing protein [Anaerolineaceae bacterium]